jgi:hypothetical protein
VTILHRIVLGGTSQVLSHVPLGGRVTTATFVLEDADVDPSSESRVIAEGAATVASWSLTSTAVAGSSTTHANRIVTNTTPGGAAIGEPALVVAPDGTREMIEVAAISSNAYIEATAGLAGTYPIGTIVYGTRISAAVPDLFASSETRLEQQHRLRVTWVYTLDGVPRRLPESVEFVRHTDLGDALAGEAVLWLQDTYSQIGSLAPEGLSLTRVAARMVGQVANDLRARKRVPERTLIGDRGRDLLCARILVHLGENGWAPGTVDPTVWWQHAQLVYTQRLDSLTIGTDAPSSTETTPADTAAPPTSRSLFMEM